MTLAPPALFAGRLLKLGEGAAWGTHVREEWGVAV